MDDGRWGSETVFVKLWYLVVVTDTYCLVFVRDDGVEWISLYLSARPPCAGAGNSG